MNMHTKLLAGIFFLKVNRPWFGRVFGWWGALYGPQGGDGEEGPRLLLSAIADYVEGHVHKNRITRASSEVGCSFRFWLGLSSAGSWIVKSTWHDNGCVYLKIANGKLFLMQIVTCAFCFYRLYIMRDHVLTGQSSVSFDVVVNPSVSVMQRWIQPVVEQGCI